MSRFILSMIKALVGEGMRRRERDRELSVVGKGRGQEQVRVGRNRHTKMEGVSLGSGERICERGRGHTCFAVNISLSHTFTSGCPA